MTLAIGRTGRRVMYAEQARAWTEAPATLTGLWRQRYRWSYGTMQAIWKHRGAVVSRDPRQRRIGRRAIPYMVSFQVLLPMIAPLIDLLALYGLIFTDPVPVAIGWLAFNALQLALAVFAFRLDRESLRPLSGARASMAERTSAPQGAAIAVATGASGDVAAQPQRAQSWERQGTLWLRTIER